MVTVKVTPNTDGPSYTVFEEVLHNYFPHLQPSPSAGDIIHALLSAKNITLTIDNVTKVITQIADTSLVQHASQSSQQLATVPCEMVDQVAAPSNQSASQSFPQPKGVHDNAVNIASQAASPKGNISTDDSSFVPLLHLEVVP